MEQRDPIEDLMGKDVEDMTGGELAVYIREYLKIVGIDMPMDGIVERKTMESFKRRYPGDRAGRIVQYAMLSGGGRKDGEWIRTAMFSQRMKWWTDKLWGEVQEESLRQQSWQENREEVESGWATLDDL